MVGTDLRLPRPMKRAEEEALAGQAGKDFAGGIVCYSGSSVPPLCHGVLLAVPITKFRQL
jgi:hypothetical protein